MFAVSVIGDHDYSSVKIRRYILPLHLLPGNRRKMNEY